MSIKTIYQIFSLSHDALEQYKADVGKAMPPYLDQVFLGSVIKLLAQLAVVAFGISVSPELQGLITQNLAIVIPAMLALYGAFYKLYGMIHAAKQLAVTKAQVEVNTVVANQAMAGVCNDDDSK